MNEARAAPPLQPSLLDRLTDEAPDRATEGRESRFIAPSRLRDLVKRDLSWLFNTTRLSATDPAVGADSRLATSVLNYGIPDLGGRLASGEALAALEEHLRQAICAFEPRLIPSSVQVRVSPEHRAVAHQVAAFEIEADLWADPAPIRLLLRTEVDLDAGHVKVSEPAAGGGA